MKLIKIPRNLFQTWEISELTQEMNLLTSSWKINNPNYAYFLFNDNERKQFIKKNFNENVYNAYCKIVPGAFKADLWRYCALYIYGGVCVDLDSLCLNSIDNFLDENIEFITAVDLNNCPTIGKYNLTCGFIASIPKHPILFNCIERIVYNIENNIVSKSNLDFSGPGVLGKSVNAYLKLPEETPFVGKEGIINNIIKLLHFEYSSEYIKDINTNKILFQNKNGNKIIQDIYNNEIKRINYTDWGTCKNPIQQQTIINCDPINNLKLTNSFNKEQHITIVTMCYDIRKKEGNFDINNPLNRGIEKYCNLAKEFILKLPFNLIIFTDCQEVFDCVRQFKGYGAIIIDEPFENTYYYKHYNKLQELQTKFTIENGNIKQETPMYIILNNNKFHFMEKAINANPFNSTHFIWMDFGINHIAKDTHKILEWAREVPDKVKQMCINPYIEPITSHKEVFKYIYHHTAGGLFSGLKENLLEYCNLFKQKTEQIYNEDWYQLDEAVMTIVQRENPLLFEFYYGDYEGIISNYVIPEHNIHLILNASQKYINYNYNYKAFKILELCDEYFYNKCIFTKILFDSNILTCIQQHIIVDYYINNKELTNYAILFINKMKTVCSDAITKLLKENENNLNFYSNKSQII